MKKDPLEVRLESYYKQLKNPKKIIGKWAIVDDVLLTKLKKIKIENINDMYSNKDESIIIGENKKHIIVIKHNIMFIAIKIIENEYQSLIDDWSLIAVNQQYLYGGKTDDKESNKSIMKLLGFKMTKKAMSNFAYFDNI